MYHMAKTQYYGAGLKTAMQKRTYANCDDQCRNEVHAPKLRKKQGEGKIQ